MNIKFTMLLMLSFAASLSFAEPVPDESHPLQYKSPAEPVHYQIRITVDSPSEVATYEGRTSYAGADAESENIKLKFSGGLNKTVKAKGRGRFGPGGPRGFGGPPGFPGGPFAATTALQQTTSNVVIASTGEVLSMTGSSQIPLPLGHLAILVFDTLPDKATDSWSAENGVLLGRSDSDRRVPRRPFDNGSQDRTSSGSETATYKVTSKEGSRITMTKDYKLDSPNSDVPFTFAGTGTLVFDSEIGMFASADLKYDLKLTPKNVDVRIPVTISYRLLSQAEVTEMQRVKQEKADVALAQGMEAALKSFADRTEEQIAEIYAKGGQVPPTGHIITPEMELPVGLIAQNKWPNEYKWSATRIAQILPNNMIKIQSLESKRYYIRNRNTLSLAPEFVQQPDGVDRDLTKKLYESLKTP